MGILRPVFDKSQAILSNHPVPRYASYIPDGLVESNAFRTASAQGRLMDDGALPSAEDVRALLPAVRWDGRPAAAACWDAAWSLALANLRRPVPGSGFVSRFIDPAFNGSLFMWDSAFISMFTRYGRRAFDFQRTLDNFYARQHPDGYICREIVESTGEDAFDRFDPDSTGPDLLPWAEAVHFRHTGDRARLESVLPCLIAYHRWLRRWRTWPDGSSWATGWASGMDNQPRLPSGCNPEHEHGRMSWIDACLQRVFSARLLNAMNIEAGGHWDTSDLRADATSFTAYVNDRMWNERDTFYEDRWPDGSLSGVKSIAAYWALLAGVAGRDRIQGLVEHLENPAEFNRPHRVPSLSADHPLYRPGGDYWRGSVWPPATYMVLEGLTACGQRPLARRIAFNHFDNVCDVFQRTGTFWENYAPESAAPGEQAAKDFVGWTGLAPIAVLLEHVFGLHPDAASGRLEWDAELTDGFAVQRYPFGADGVVDLECARRTSAEQRPSIRASSSVGLELVVRWPGGCETLRLTSGRTTRTGG